MRTARRLTLSVAAALLLAGPGRAQVIYAPFNIAYSNSLTMLRSPEVCRELKIDEDQAPKIDAALEPAERHYREGLDQLRGLSREQSAPRSAALRKEVADEGRKAVARVLKPEQLKRYDQLAVQRMGPDAFADPEVQKKLKLTTEQQEQVKQIAEEKKQAMSRLQVIRSDTLQRLSAEQTEKTVAILTPEQKRVWEDLTGSPFELKPGWLLKLRKKPAP
jgi:hypothetical protein